MEESAVVPKSYPNIPPILGVVVSNKVATLHELKTVYSLEDVYWMYEAIMLPKYNEWREYKAREPRNKK